MSCILKVSLFSTRRKSLTITIPMMLSTSFSYTGMREYMDSRNSPSNSPYVALTSIEVMSMRGIMMSFATESPNSNTL